MIINHKYKFIFLKTAKTASTSIEIALSKHCGNNDIITPMLPADEEIRHGLKYPAAQNYLSPITGYAAKELFNLVFRKAEKKQRYYHHISAQEVKKYIGDKTWNSYFKFCVERNPWERIISLYYWMHQTEPRPTFSEFLGSEMPSWLKKFGFHLYTIDGEIALNKICLYENLEDDLEQVCLHLGIPEKLQLPFAKIQHRKDQRSYQEILNQEQKEKIANMFEQEIRLFGYKY